MKKALVFGVGISGLSAIKYMKRHELDYVWYDDKPNENLINDGILELDKQFDGNFADIGYVLKSEGILKDHEILCKAKDLNIDIKCSLDIFSETVDCSKIIGITGTNGKTTTTTLVEKLLNDGGYRAVACGNIGKGLLDYVDDEEIDYYVLELSSFQLELSEKIKPKYAVILNISPDHIEWHKTFENYVNAKLQIIKNMDESDILILNGNDPILSKIETNASVYGLWKEVKCSYYITIEDGYVNLHRNDTTELLCVNDIKLQGVHNHENIMAAILIAHLIGVDKESIKKTISGFYGVDHRLRLVAVNSGVQCYDDSKGTNPDSTIKAVEALEKDILLILGGYDKNVSFDELISLCKSNVKAIAAMGQTRSQIIDTCNRLGFKNVYSVEDMEDAVRTLMQISQKGDKLLLSPACASWGMYENYKQRGEHFIKILNELVI